MKRYGNLYNNILDIENLELAHRKARRGKASYKEVKMVNKNTKDYMLKIQKSLAEKTYKTGKYGIFSIYDKGKERIISKLPYYPDRICHHAIMNVIEPIFIKTFTADTYASLPARGIHSALAKLKQQLRNKNQTRYCLKIDIKKFFPNVDHNILKKMIRLKFKDKNLLWLLDEIIDSVDGGKGIPIGNYLSQYFANFYLSYFDHWIKETKKVKYYYRYMDDMIFFSSSKKSLHQLQHEIIEYLKNNLLLELKSNRQIFPTHLKPLDFVGYKFVNGKFYLRKSIATRFKRKMRNILNKKQVKEKQIMSISSYEGWLKWCESYELKKKYVYPIRRLQNENTKLCNARTN
jgi:hypothetical protein